MLKKIEITLVKKCSDRRKNNLQIYKINLSIAIFYMKFVCDFLTFLHFAEIYAGVVKKLAYLNTKTRLSAILGETTNMEETKRVNAKIIIDTVKHVLPKN